MNKCPYASGFVTVKRCTKLCLTGSKEAIGDLFWSQPVRDNKKQSREVESTQNTRKPTNNYQNQTHVLHTVKLTETLSMCSRGTMIPVT